MAAQKKQLSLHANIVFDLAGVEDDLDFSPGVESAWEEEICRRMKSVTTGAARARSFDAVFADLDRRFGR
jgi:hypothetical protein